jgi:hypothetical protein
LSDYARNLLRARRGAQIGYFIDQERWGRPRSPSVMPGQLRFKVDGAAEIRRAM